MKVKLIK